MPNKVTNIREPDPVTLALATGRIAPCQVTTFNEVYDKNPNTVLSLLRGVPAGAIQTYEAKQAGAAEISRFARTRGMSFGDAYVEIHRLANEVAREPVYGPPEAA